MSKRKQDEDAQDEADWQRTVVKLGSQRQRKPMQARKQKAERFVQVPLWWIEMAAQRAKSPATLVLIELLYAAWKAKSPTFPLPNVRLQRLGVSRDVKRRVLRDLERGGVILVERRPRKTPIITLIGFGG